MVGMVQEIDDEQNSNWLPIWEYSSFKKFNQPKKI